MTTGLDVLRRYAADHQGVVTGAAAATLGVRAVELLDRVLVGELALIANDVYRLYDLITPLTEYAEAVALAGPGAALADDAVVAMHDLASVNPRRIRVAVPRPLPDDVRLPVTVEVVVRELAPEDITEVEGIPTMTVAAALRACRGRVLTGRLLQGVDRALEGGLLDPATAEVLRIEFASPALREQVRRNVEAQYALETEFGLLSAADIARLAGGTAAAPERLVQDWLEQGRVFVVPAADGERLPGFQFDERGVPRPGHRRRAALVRRPPPHLGAGAVVHRLERLGRRRAPGRRARQRPGTGRAGRGPPGRGAAVSGPADDGLTRDQLRSLLLGYAVAGRIVADPVGTLALARENLRRMRWNAARGTALRWFDERERLLDARAPRMGTCRRSTSSPT
jgi:hypothetical protein